MTARPVTVSVVICVRNGAQVIHRQLDALEAQVDAPPFEVVVVDNGSTDDTRQVVERWQAAARTPVATRIVTGTDKPNIPRNRNLGARAARGDIVAFCDADDRVAPDWVAVLAATTPPDGLVGGVTEAYEANGTHRPDASTYAINQTAYLPYCPTCNIGIGRECLVALGGFDESLPPYGWEDVDFSWRAQEAGRPVEFNEDLRIRFTVSGKMAAVRKEFLTGQGKMAMIARHPEFSRGAYTLASCVADLARQSLLLPVRMARPGSTPRSRHIRWLVNSAGRLAGYVVYRIGNKPARYVSLED